MPESGGFDDMTTIGVAPTPMSHTGSEVTNFPHLSGDLSPTEIYRLYGQAAIESIPQRQGFIDHNLVLGRRLAAGSPQVLREQLGGQLEAIQQQLDQTFTAISRRLGPSGGGQLERGKRDAVAGANQALRQTLVGGQLQGLANISRHLSGFRPVFAASLPQTVEQSQPINVAPLYGQAAGNLVTAGQRLFGSAPAAPAAPVQQPGYSAPITPMYGTVPGTQPIPPSQPVYGGPSTYPSAG